MQARMHQRALSCNTQYPGRDSRREAEKRASDVKASAYVVEMTAVFNGLGTVITSTGLSMRGAS
jgi:hypothetical protein